MNVAQYGLTWQRSRTVKYIKSVSEQFNFHRHSLKLFPIYRVPHFFLLKTKQTNVDKCEQINCESIYCKPTFIHVKKKNLQGHCKYFSHQPSSCHMVQIGLTQKLVVTNRFNVSKSRNKVVWNKIGLQYHSTRNFYGIVSTSQLSKCPLQCF